jgi:hypothetical protein
MPKKPLKKLPGLAASITLIDPDRKNEVVETVAVEVFTTRRVLANSRRACIYRHRIKLSTKPAGHVPILEQFAFCTRERPVFDTLDRLCRILELSYYNRGHSHRVTGPLCPHHQLPKFRPGGDNSPFLLQRNS